MGTQGYNHYTMEPDVAKVTLRRLQFDTIEDDNLQPFCIAELSNKPKTFDRLRDNAKLTPA